MLGKQNQRGRLYNSPMDLSAYDYQIPDELIALKPAEPRDHARLLIYNTKTDEISFDYFSNLAQYLPSNGLMVLNNTKVLPARITLYKNTGGKVTILLLLNEVQENGRIKILADRKLQIGEVLSDANHLQILSVTAQNEAIFEVQLRIPYDDFRKILDEKGVMPIPPYLKQTTMTRDELMEQYQTIFAKQDGSVAAPTASLHFTQSVFDALEEKGVQKAFVTLHVGMGTFAPLTEKQMQEKTLHHEYYDIPQETIEKLSEAKQNHQPIIAIGTTVTRTIESFGKTITKQGGTNLFIYPPYSFTYVDCLITNFHVPKSSLMMLVEAFLQHKKSKRHLVDIYVIAIVEKFRFFSFGDALLII